MYPTTLFRSFLVSWDTWGQSVAMLLFTGVSTIGMASGAGYRIAAVCAAVLCGLGGIVFAFYNEKKVLGVLET